MFLRVSESKSVVLEGCLNQSCFKNLCVYYASQNVHVNRPTHTEHARVTRQGHTPRSHASDEDKHLWGRWQNKSRLLQHLEIKLLSVRKFIEFVTTCFTDGHGVQLYDVCSEQDG